MKKSSVKERLQSFLERDELLIVYPELARMFCIPVIDGIAIMAEMGFDKTTHNPYNSPGTFVCQCKKIINNGELNKLVELLKPWALYNPNHQINQRLNGSI